MLMRLALWGLSPEGGSRRGLERAPVASRA